MAKWRLQQPLDRKIPEAPHTQSAFLQLSMHWVHYLLETPVGCTGFTETLGSQRKGQSHQQYVTHRIYNTWLQQYSPGPQQQDQHKWKSCTNTFLWFRCFHISPSLSHTCTHTSRTHEHTHNDFILKVSNSPSYQPSRRMMQWYKSP